MDAKLILDAKREGAELEAGEIGEFVAAFMRGDVTDYQMSAFLMAVCCRGMSKRETNALTQALLKSGTELDWSHLDRPTADKHSTGGVGDKISLVCLPVAAACGVAVPSLMGRGLGLTGGTVDKLETIPGFNATLNGAEFARTVEKCGLAMSAVSPDIAPADGRLYALRDVTGTVASIPLITASILSKKLAEGAETLVFDVKCGSGAFMKTPREARALARSLVEGAKAAGRKAFAYVTDMNSPLGRAVGNRNEVREAIAVLQNDPAAPEDVRALSLTLAERMVSLAKEIPIAAARRECRAVLAGGAAFEAFRRMVEAQGGDLAKLPPAPKGRVVTAREGGVVGRIDALATAKICLAAGALRRVKTDSVDAEAGVNFFVGAGEPVSPGQPLYEVLGDEAALPDSRIVGLSERA